MLTMHSCYIDDFRNLWVDVHCDGRRQWAIACSDLKDDVRNKEELAERAQEIYRDINFEEYFKKLPNIEDADIPMQWAYSAADSSGTLYCNFCYRYSDTKFKQCNCMTKEDFRRRLKADMKKYGINEDLIESIDDPEYMYRASILLTEYFTAPVDLSS